MALHNELRQQILLQLKYMIIETLRNEDVRVYLFGSWARNEEKKAQI